MASKNILAIQLKAYLQTMNETVLWVGFIDLSSSILLLHYNTVALGQEIFDEADINTSCNRFFDSINSAKNNYSIDTENVSRVTEVVNSNLDSKVVGSIITKMKENDTGGIAHVFKRLFDHTFQTDDTKASAVCKRITHGHLEVINAIERKQANTVAHNSEIAEKYVGKSSEAIRKIVEDNAQDTIVLLFNIVKSGKIVCVGSLLYNSLVEEIMYKNIIYSRDLPSEQFSTTNYIVDLYHAVEEFSQSGNSVNDLAQKVSSSLENIHSERFGLTLAGDDPAKIAALLARALPGEFSSSTVSVQTQKLNSIIVDTVFSPEISINNSSDDNEDEVEEKNVVSVDVDLVLSPTKGVKVSTLTAGKRIYVIINANTLVGNKVVKQLNLLEDNRVKPLSGVVESVKRDSKGHFVVKVRLASNLVGKAIEEEDIKVKSGDPVVDQVSKTSNRSLIVGLAIGVFLIIIAVLSVVILL